MPVMRMMLNSWPKPSIGNELEITLHGPFMDLSPGGVDQRVKEVTSDRFIKTIELALFFKPKTIVFHPGYEKWKFNGNVNLWLESSLQTWKPLVKEAEETGLTLVIENVFEETPDTIKTLLEEIQFTPFSILLRYRSSPCLQ